MAELICMFDDAPISREEAEIFLKLCGWYQNSSFTAFWDNDAYELNEGFATLRQAYFIETGKALKLMTDIKTIEFY